MKLKVLNGYFAPMLVACFALSQQAGAADAPATDNSADLTKQLANPISNLISWPTKVDWDTDIGPEDADRTTYTTQPVIPIGLNDDWNVISRTIIPVYIDAESPVAGGDDESGMGDILQSFFFSPKKPTSGGLIWGIGPVLDVPTGDDGLTSDKFSVGPTIVLLKQTGPWTLGFLGNQLWDVSGDDDAEDVNSTYLQPFLSFNTKTHTTFSINTESTYNHEADSGDELTVPINLLVSQLVKFGHQPVQFQVGYRHYADTPSGGPDHGIRAQVTFLFPKGQKKK
jgi:hypothetical protein